ncbi:ribbon-helix-helix protein, CopG family [Microbispora bryophytorum]|uniref:plasmid mobilization protein n=1 Tax=Microbispora bryophytorum TaxID=1460882 RepID=UPI0033D37563
MEVMSWTGAVTERENAGRRTDRRGGKRKKARGIRQLRVPAEHGARAGRAARRTVGRPSLTAPGRRSPQVTFRLSPEEKAAARALAEREGKTVSQLAREAFAQYLRDHAA